MAIQKIMASIWQTAQRNFEDSARRLGLADSIVNRLCSPREKIEVSLTPQLPDGKVGKISAFVVRHNDVLGPAKGGIRMTPTVEMEDICGLAMEMTWKTSLIGVPFGGGKSGIRIDPLSLTAGAKETLIRSFTRGVQRHLGPEIYIPAPDMGTNEADMGHIADCLAYSAGVSITKGCCVTGKPVVFGGILGRREATGKGVAYSIVKSCAVKGIALKGSRLVVQGFGNVGSVAATHLVAMGAKLIGVSDLTGAIYNERGIDPIALLSHVGDSGGVINFEGTSTIGNQEIFELPCDILVPAATGSVITPSVAESVKASIIAEGANAPTIPEADEILNSKGIFIIPDILCNAGGVFVSYLEYTQETQRGQMTLNEIEERLQSRMYQRFEDVHKYAQTKNLTLRQAAMDIAVRHVAEAVEARAFLP